MLADDIIGFPGTPVGRKLLTPGMRHGFETIGKRLPDAARFVLNRDAVMLVQTISESSPRRFLAALGVCRLPFPRLWVEFAYKDRADWLDSVAQRGVSVVKRDDSPPPSRLGFYLEQLDTEGRDILVQPAWTHNEYASLALMTLRINTGVAFSAGSDPASEMWIDTIRDSAGPEWDEICRRVRCGVPAYLGPQWAEATEAGLPKLVDHAIYDLRSEWRFALALLTVLNSRNVVSIGDPVRYDKLNKRRVLKGAAPLLPHRDIRLSLSKIQRYRVGAAIGNASDLRAVLVMGHWKLRRSGLFWWSPHVRGRYGRPAPRTYSVSA